ncbi:RecQ family ATP-dependent DNA helicase [Cupriavidus pauculus]|uniref:DNA 3'-5' helicase n=1 Tax=Cupriavidus pauculus TaxID=82633 RepID=A0A2N5C8J8_9BURK|nr:RecQ family ATP-dependent DNA helicase [Cupriavidus pauculus]PLP98546.1 RecQ family ATP-dependent DNA helicase [Cupriavidus pauculus]
MADEEVRTERRGSFSPKCVSIDLEVGVTDSRIHQFAAVRGDTGEALVHHRGDLYKALEALDVFSQRAAFVLGHNLIAFDLPHLAAANPGMQLLGIPAVDTLRLNPLAFPRNPYHHLVKHYQDGQLRRGRLNNPELDARLTLEVFGDQHLAMQQLNASQPDYLIAWHWLTTVDEPRSGLNAFFSSIRSALRPTDEEAVAAIDRLLEKHTCLTQRRKILAEAARNGWSLAYALAWLSVSGGNSVMPPWVRHQFPQTGDLIKRLRDSPCDASDCAWCSDRHNPDKELARWFPAIPGFRPQPTDENGHSLQRSIVAAAMRGDHVLGILPTGTGKSVCYQVPALSRFDKTGALTVVISPLVALMADQVSGMEAKGITCCAALNGMLSMPERADVLDRVRMGDIGILIVSPEQLRNPALRKAMAQREIGAWVLDEAHCLSKWGHDFRPDYRYVGRFIKDRAGQGSIPAVLCLTATAKPDVVDDIITHFRDKVGIQLTVFNGGANRDNLDFEVVPTTPEAKYEHISQVIIPELAPDRQDGAIIYCSTRKRTEELASFLRAKEVNADHFHAGLPPETKKNVQERFIRGDLRVITATNAFGMGIDKPDVRLVVHADIPGSLENYLQEAGRAGRDGNPARCVLLYTVDDVERQFGMSARSRLTRNEIQAILYALRNLDRKKRLGGEVIATTGEILAEDEHGQFERDTTTEDTRVRTAISWLEEAMLLLREENQVQIFPSSLRISSIDEANAKLAGQSMTEDYRRKLTQLVQALLDADADEGISTDELMGIAGLTAEKVRSALFDLERLGIASNDTALTAFVHAAVERSSIKRLQEAASMEQMLIQMLREAAPDLGKGEPTALHLRRAAQALKDNGHPNALPERVWRLVRSIAQDGQTEGREGGSIRVKRLDAESIQLHLLRPWDTLASIAELRRTAASHILDHLLACLPATARGLDLLAETTLGKLLASLDADATLRTQVKDSSKLLDRALLWLHEQEIIRLNKGLAVFRPAMTIRLEHGKRGFQKTDFTPLQQHYEEQVTQIHVMAEYAQRGLLAMQEAHQMVGDYFRSTRDEFLGHWLPHRGKELSRQTTPESWQKIVETLSPSQRLIVADDREQTNVLVLAGPGSGKTRVLVHRIAYLIRARRENPQGILALAYNRHAAMQIRKRLADLIGDDAKGVTILTCHALAMRLAGVSFAGKADKVDGVDFKEVLEQAIGLLEGSSLPPEEADLADEQRQRLLAGFRWILVDEYQDIGPEQYRLISALAGRTLQDDDSKLTLFAVGDDDQNIYGFDGASVEFIRRFADDYQAKPQFLIENYRSTAHIIEATNALIAVSADRMKSAQPIAIDRARRGQPGGGWWESVDPVVRGRVQVLPTGESHLKQALLAVTELERLATLNPDWKWSTCAVIAREWRYLEPVRAYCEYLGIPVQMADEEATSFWQLRETQSLLGYLRSGGAKLISSEEIFAWLDLQPEGPWWAMLREAADTYGLETLGAAMPRGHFTEWLAEWGREARRRQNGLLLLTAHRSKGLEFDHVIVLDGGWEKLSSNEDADAPRRLYYVAMTRARSLLILCNLSKGNQLVADMASTSIMKRPPTRIPEAVRELSRQYRRLTMAEVDLGFCGRHDAANAVHATVAALQPGSPLHVRRNDQRWELLDTSGVVVGRLSAKCQMPSHSEHITASVHAIITRRLDQTDVSYKKGMRTDQWEVVLPELVIQS